MAKRRVSDTEYSGAWWAGFRGAVYEQEQNLVLRREKSSSSGKNAEKGSSGE